MNSRIPIVRSQAARVKSQLMIGYVLEPRAPFFIKRERHSGPTIDSPSDLTITERGLVSKMKGIFIFNRATRNVYRRYEIDESNWIVEAVSDPKAPAEK